MAWGPGSLSFDYYLKAAWHQFASRCNRSNLKSLNSLLCLCQEGPRIGEPEACSERRDRLYPVDPKTADGLAQPVPCQKVPHRQIEIEKLRLDITRRRHTVLIDIVDRNALHVEEGLGDANGPT